MAQRSVTRDIPKLSLRASFEPSTVNIEKRTIELVWTTGAPVLRGYFDQFWEELSLDPKHVRMERLNNGAPLLNVHDRYSLESVLGVVESAHLEKKRGVATVRFPKAEDDPDADAIFRKVVDGIIRNVSVGYQIHKLEKVSEEKGKVPVYRAVDWEPQEISIVPIGADAGAGVRSDSVTTNPCVFIEERAMDPENPTPTPAPAPAPTPAPQPVAAPGDQRSAVDERAVERARVLGIQRIGATLKRTDAEIADAISKGTTLDAFRAAAVDALAEAPPEAGGVVPFQKRGTEVLITFGEDSRDKYRRSGVSWLLQRAGLAQMVAEGAAKRGEKIDLDPGEFRGMTLKEMARDCLERCGVRTRGLDAMEMVGQAFTRIGPGLQSTSDFPYILETALHRTLLGAYETTPDTWRRFAKKGSVSDFRAHTRYRQGAFGVLETVLEGGEYKNAAIPDAVKESISALTKGRIVGITRQAIINDDMGAFDDVATRLGRAAALTIEVDVYALLALNAGLGPAMSDGATLFHASHGNITTGAALSAAALDLDSVAMGIQKDPSNNEFIELVPSILLIGRALGGQARIINDSQFDPDTVANKSQNKPNIAGKMFDDIIATARVSGTRRYLFADPNIAPVIEVVFLNGNETPYLEMKEGWRIDGTEWKVRLDSGVGAVDWRGAITNAGA